jgi:hypothetical protein
VKVSEFDESSGEEKEREKEREGERIGKGDFECGKWGKQTIPSFQ